ncbi:MAG: hypothetical protein ACXWD8_18040 [Mycobacterium sp.]
MTTGSAAGAAWRIESTIDSVNVARPHCVGGNVPTKAMRSATSPLPLLLNGTGKRVNTT